MFREMRRSKQALTYEEAEAILRGGASGVLALSGDGGYPYAVPLSYVYADGRLYFHCARAGHKLDAIRRDDRASFCVVERDGIVPEEYTTYFRSAIAFGRLRVLESDAERRAAIERLALKYNPNDPEGRKKEIDGSFSALCVLEMSIEHLSGKEAKELASERKRTPT